MVRVFVSQPMAGKSNAEIHAVAEKAIKRVREISDDKDAYVIHSFYEELPFDGITPLWFLGKSLEYLSTADVAFFASNWQSYRGCQMEHEAAMQYGIPIIEDYSE